MVPINNKEKLKKGAAEKHKGVDIGSFDTIIS